MSAAELRRELRRQRRAMRRALRHERQHLRQKVRALRAGAKRAHRGRRRTLLAAAVAVVVILLLLSRCEGALVPGGFVAAPAPPASVAPTRPTSPVTAPLRGAHAKQQRPAFELEALDSRPWLAAYRLQVMARSVLLARCFEGASRPGALRWTATVDPLRGEVSDHEIEMAGGGDLSAMQRGCVARALSEPRYGLRGVGAQASPQRVSLVIEF